MADEFVPSLLGVLSDTHGRADACRTVVDQLNALHVKHFIHCGDIGDGPGGEAVLDALAGTGCHFVWGNNDFDRDRLAPYATDLGLRVLGDVGHLTVANHRILVTHGDNLRLLRDLRHAAKADEPKADLLLTGHSHLPHDERVGDMRWVNPGALFRANPKTFCTIDLSRLSDPEGVTFHRLKG